MAPVQPLVFECCSHCLIQNSSEEEEKCRIFAWSTVQLESKQARRVLLSALVVTNHRFTQKRASKAKSWKCSQGDFSEKSPHVNFLNCFLLRALSGYLSDGTIETVVVGQRVMGSD